MRIVGTRGPGLDAQGGTGDSNPLRPHRTHALSTRLAALALVAVPMVGGAGNGRVDLTALPAGRWVEIADSKLSAVAAKPSPGGAISKIMAWSGGALDTRRQLLLVWGGGHNDYAGNEVYAFDIGRQEWSRLTDPSPPDLDRTEAFADGRPRSRHTYDYLEYVPTIDRLVSFGGAALYPHGVTYSRQVAEFDVESRSWSLGRRAPLPDVGNMIGAHARVDPRSGDVFVLPSQRSGLLRYSPSVDRWTQGLGRTYVRVHSTAAIDPGRRLFLVIGSGNRRQALKWNLDRPDSPIDLRPLTHGDVEIEAAYGPGLDFHPRSGKFVAWAGGTDVYVLDPANWGWTRVPASAGNRVDPGPQLRTGTYGRFRYVESIDAFILVNGANQNVFFYRIPADAGSSDAKGTARARRADAFPQSARGHSGA